MNNFWKGNEGLRILIYSLVAFFLLAFVALGFYSYYLHETKTRVIGEA